MDEQVWEKIMIRAQWHAVRECGTCGIIFTVPLAMIQAAWADGGYQYCPNGHQRGWKDGHVEREAVRLERDRLKQRVAQLDDAVKAAADRAEKTAAELKRHKKRASAGTCPCCNRTFSNMARHMATQHPEFTGKGKVVPLLIERGGMT